MGDLPADNQQNKGSTLEIIEESELKLLACTNSFSPRKSDLYFNKDLQLERLLITNLLSEYVRRGNWSLRPVRCLDALSGAGINGLLWQKHIVNDIEVNICTPHASAVNTIQENAKRNSLNVNVINKDVCVLLHEEPFNFIHIDCHTDASHYFDAAFRNLSRNGMLVITTKDDSSLYGRNPEGALRNYNGVITKTSYGTELGIRLVIAAMARSATRYSRAVKVVCCSVFKNSFIIAVTAIKGPRKTNSVLQNIRRLVHCSMCEERAFYPVSDGFIVDKPAALLSCKCHLNYPGKVVMELGPVWAGEIFDAGFLKDMLEHNKIPLRDVLNAFIAQLLSETMSPVSVKKESNQNNNDDPPPKKIKIEEETSEDDNSEKSTTPPFYYNLPRHSPKTPHLMPIDKVIQALKKAGYKASRTHFDKEAVRTNANAERLMSVIQDCLDKR